MTLLKIYPKGGRARRIFATQPERLVGLLYIILMAISKWLRTKLAILGINWMNCDVCGADLRDNDGFLCVGKQVSLLGAHPAKAKVEEVFGKSEFRVCYVCLLKSLGVKALRKKE